MPQVAVVTESHLIGAPGPELLAAIESLDLGQGDAICLTEIEGAAKDCGPNERAAAFVASARRFYASRNIGASEPMEMDLYPSGSDGTEIRFVGSASSLGSPGTLMDYLEPHITASTLTLTDAREAASYASEDGELDETGQAFLQNLKAHYEGAALDEDDPVLVSIG